MLEVGYERRSYARVTFVGGFTEMYSMYFFLRQNRTKNLIFTFFWVDIISKYIITQGL